MNLRSSHLSDSTSHGAGVYIFFFFINWCVHFRFFMFYFFFNSLSYLLCRTNLGAAHLQNVKYLMKESFWVFLKVWQTRVCLHLHKWEEEDRSDQKKKKCKINPSTGNFSYVYSCRGEENILGISRWRKNKNVFFLISPTPLEIPCAMKPSPDNVCSLF
jgi:hypothetical protein